MLKKTLYIKKNALPENLAVHDTMWRNVAEPENPQMAMRTMRFAS